MNADTNGSGAAEKAAADTAEGTEPASAGAEGSDSSWLRRLLRNRTTHTIAAGVIIGGLLGAGTMAWQTDSLPLLGPAPCWDSLSDSTVSAVFGDRRIDVEEQKLQPDPRGRGLVYGQCRITSFKGDEDRRQLTIRVHKLDGLYGSDARKWPEEYLAAGMVALGDGLPGMGSSSRAWLAVPQSCTGRPGDFEGPVVVDVEMGPAGLDIESEYEREDRAALAHAAVDATNGVIRDLGCSGTYPTPALAKDVVTWKDTQPDAFCGIKDLSLPAEYRQSLSRMRIGGDSAPARVCEAAGDYPRTVLRMTTIEDPALAEVFSQDLLKGGTPFQGSNGRGTFNVTRAVYRARCQTGYVTYVLEQKDQLDKTGFELLRAMTPTYIEAESERIGCGPEKVTMPRS
ncbi:MULTISPECIES: hypothetical protein [unclassified Streptomyces]|uniref:hypothetical protein n=1 Tax=unclassified Streptomyces TaxID=2593676 RepID=UPI002035CF00|nr:MULTISPECIES: hypothetical protein [unclassified Streptomyces]